MNSNNFKIGACDINANSKTYFIADIAANHDGDIDRAKQLILLAKNSGADAVKMQHHNCNKYVSDFGFKQLGVKQSHQSQWGKSVFDVYKDAEVPLDWTPILKKYSDKIGIEFFSTPYDLDMIDHIDPYVNAYKIGSGDLNWDEMLIKIAQKGKPVLIASGASNIGEVQHAINILQKHTSKIILFQCNTNYTGSLENLKYVNLNVLKTYATMFPSVILGLSDHTHGDISVLGAVALGAKVIEKHFTDDTTRNGPDHPFSMDPKTWREMVDRTRLIEASLGETMKRVQDNEKETVILQRRAIRVIKDLKAGDIITDDIIEYQRPAPKDCFLGNDIGKVLNKTLSKSIVSGDYLRIEHIS
jgi:N-acetylneuraminate synthase